jgi:hypothetical protein
MIWPVDASVSQEYGSNPTAQLPADSWLIRTFGNYQPNGHTGVDFPVNEGTPVRAVANGVVRHVGWYSGSYADNPYWISPSFAGFVLVIDHGGYIGIYAHLSGSPVAVGETVREGQTVAYSGNTGGSTGPHLHFEVLPDGWDFSNGMYGRVNPAQYFGAAAIAPQSSTPVQEDTLSAAEVKEIKGHINAVLIGGYTWNGKQHPGGLMVVEEEQRRAAADRAQIKGLVGAIAALAKGEAFDEAKLLAGVQAAAEAGVKAGIADGTVTVDVQVNGAAA